MGDLIIDETWYVNTKKISPEAPVPVGFLTSEEPYLSPGGASLAASYATKQNYPIHFLTATNKERAIWLNNKGIDTHYIEVNTNVVKTRYIDIKSNYHLIRIDNDDIVKRPHITTDELDNMFDSLLDRSLCVAFLDYRKGMFANEEKTQLMIAKAVKKNLPVYVDTRCNPLKFRHATFLKLNENEYNAAKAALNINSPEDLCKTIGTPNLIVTEGKKGATLYTINNPPYHHTPNKSKVSGVPDVTGCGDVFDINFCYYCFYRGLPPTDALRFSVEEASKYAHTPIGDRLC